MLRKLIDQRSSSSSSLDPLVPIFHDGGFATECERRGVELNHRLWSTKVLLDAPETVVGVHRSFLDHGSDVVSTATYQLHGKAAATVGCNVRELAAQAVHAARKACDECQRGLVAGSLGPYGATIPGGLEFTGDYRAPDEGFAAFHRPRIEALVEAGVDLILLETFPRADEAVEAALVAHEIAGEKSIPIVVSMTMRFDTTPQDVAPRVVTAAGDSPMTTFQTLQGIPSVAFVGVNCSEPEVATALLSELAATNGGWRLRDDVGLAVYPNSGERYVAGEQVGTGSWDASHMQGPQASIGNRLAAHWPTWHRLLVACGGGRSRLPLLLGGCCRVYPEDIRGLRDAVVS